MDVVTWLLYRRENKLDLLREKRVRRYGKDTAHALVRRVSDAAGRDAGSSEPDGPGIAVHYGLGMAPGALYAQQRHQHSWLRAGRGVVGHAVLGIVTEATLNAVEGDVTSR
jgi:hypothetical protein